MPKQTSSSSAQVSREHHAFLLIVDAGKTRPCRTLCRNGLALSMAENFLSGKEAPTSRCSSTSGSPSADRPQGFA